MSEIEYTPKQCKQCKKLYPPTLDHFPREKRNRDGLTGTCRNCLAERNRLKYLADLENNRQKHREYEQLHADERRSRYKRWLANNPGKRIEYDHRYNDKHREKVNAANRRSSKIHRETRRRNVNAYRSRARALPATLTCNEWDAIKAEWGFACAYCGKSIWDLDHRLQQDHVIPVKQGGGYTATNIVPACRSCNARKNARTPEQAGMALRPKPTLDLR